MKALADVRPLRESAVFRRLWLGTTASGFGGQMSAFAMLYYLYDTTGSAATVGLAGLAAGVPMIVIALAGSAFLDHVDRRRLALACTGVQIVTTAGMAAVAFGGGGGVAAMLALLAVSASCGALGAPARRTFLPAILSGERLAAGLALSHLSFQLAMLTGPALAGLLTAAAGVAWCFVVDTATFAAALAGIRGVPGGVAPGGGRPGAAAVTQGIRYAVSTPAVRGALLADLAATLLAMPVALFPVLNAERFGGRPEVLGLFTSALAVGGVAASVLSGLASHRRRAGIVMLASGAVWALTLGLAGLVTALPLVLALIAVAGAADTWAVVARGTVLQSATTEAYRGRVAALEHVVGVGGPELGNLRAGLIASVTSAGASLALGGAAALLATVLLAFSMPGLRRFRTPSDAGTPR